MKPSTILVLCFLAAGVIPLGAALLYSTDFENFPAGDDQWAGTDGWLANSKGVGVHGIDQDVISGGGLGKTAFIGYRQPAATLVFVAKPILYAPAPCDFPILEVETIVGIQDSLEKPVRDSFFVSIWNATGEYLAGVRFSNETASYGIWRLDGSMTEHDTGIVFYRGELHLLFLRIDLANNQWSAEFDGIPLFEDVTFNATGQAVDFGYLAYEWQLSASVPAGYGDNWMLVADAMVRSMPRGMDPFLLSSFGCDSTGATLSWTGENGFDYQVEYSDDLLNWFDDLPGSAFPGITTDQFLSFTDPAPIAQRFYRVVRTVTP